MARQGKRSESAGEFIKTVVIAGAIALGIRTVAFEPFNIPSESMLPTLLVGDYLFVSKYSYGYSRYSIPFGPPLFRGRMFESPVERGDVAVFRFPIDPSKDYIKRIIGLPGDRIQMIGGVLHINGRPVERRRVEDFPYPTPNGAVLPIAQFVEALPNGKQYLTLDKEPSGLNDNTKVFTVPPDHYFALGDNRDNSLDSRIDPDMNGVGFVPAENLIGRAEILFLSTDSPTLWKLWESLPGMRFSRFFTRIDGAV